MALHFNRGIRTPAHGRRSRALQKRGLDGLLMFRQESMYYLTGYDTFGYVFFQCLYLGADGAADAADPRARPAPGPAHLDHRGHPHLGRRRRKRSPRVELRDILRGFGCRGKKLGVEYEAYGLTARNGSACKQALDGFCTLGRRLRPGQPAARW